MTDLEKQILQTAQTSVNAAIKEGLTGYNSPLTKMVHKVVEEHDSQLHSVMKEAFGSVIETKDFKSACVSAFQHKLAKTMVSKLEGSVEKAVNSIRQDPTLRAKMILAIERIIESEG